MKKFHTTILVVQDDPNDGTIVEEAFRKIGVTDPIHVVNDGAEAIAYMMGEGKYSDRQAFQYPTFILTDLKMPKVDGFGVLEFLKGNPQWAIIPTVVLSGSESPDDIKKSYRLGASAYHLKPQLPSETEKLLSVLHAYWLSCEMPEVDITGKQLPTNDAEKLAETTPRQSEEKALSPHRIK